MSNLFEELAKVDCSAHVEKKGKFTYLSWPFAFGELFKRHPKAEIEAREWDGFPAVQGPKGWMVQVSVTLDGVRRTQWHPVLDSNNRPIAEPDVFQINTSLQRAAVKAIALHGLGLYIYAGEDLPEGVEPAAVETITDKQEIELKELIDANGKNVNDACAYFGIERLSQLPAARFNEAKELSKKRRRADYMAAA